MCWSERCCYVVPANWGCVLVGIFSFVLSLIALATSITFFIIESKRSPQQLITEYIYYQLTHSNHFGSTFGLNLNLSSIHIILSIVIILKLLWMVFSGMLVIGVIQNNANLVLSYFAYGIIVTIICQLTALLLILQESWVLSLVLFILSLVHIYALVVVHTVYELMSKGKDDEDPLSDCFDGDSSRV